MTSLSLQRDVLITCLHFSQQLLQARKVWYRTHHLTQLLAGKRASVKHLDVMGLGIGTNPGGTKATQQGLAVQEFNFSHVNLYPIIPINVFSQNVTLIICC